MGKEMRLAGMILTTMAGAVFSNKEKSGGHSSDSATSGIKPPSEVWVKTLVFG